MIVSGVEVPDYCPCPHCGYSWSDPVHTSTTSDYQGNVRIDVTYKCRYCGRTFTETVYRKIVN